MKKIFKKNDNNSNSSTKDNDNVGANNGKVMKTNSRSRPAPIEEEFFIESDVEDDRFVFICLISRNCILL